MEKLLLIKKLSLIALLICGLQVNSQNNFFVYKTEGTPSIKVNDSLKSLNKGSIIPKNSIVTLKTDDELLLINKLGELFKIENYGKYSFSGLNKIKPQKDETSFTKKYFTYCWNQFTNNIKTKTNGGVVYRVDLTTLMLQPADSIKIYFPEVKFSWKNKTDTEQLYFILKDVKSDHITKFGVRGATSLTLFIDNNILKRGNSYEWTVCEDKYPIFDEIPFYSFELLNSNQFKAMQSEIGAIANDLEKLGFKSDEIKTMLCEDYKVCF